MNVKEKNQEIKDYPIFNRRGKQRIKTKNYNSKREDNKEEDQREDERDVIL